MKKIICSVFLVSFFSAGILFAKIALTLDAGPVYTNFYYRNNFDNGNARNTWSTNVGGLNVLLKGEFAKNFGVYGMANFAFGKRIATGYHSKNSSVTRKWDADLSYVIDSQFGFFYAFKPVKNLDIMLGLGIGLGGSGYNTTTEKTLLTETKKTRNHYTNIGGGFNVDVSYMFTQKIGVYGGLSDTMYAPVSKSVKTIIGSSSEKTETFSGEAAGTFANSFSLKAGLQFKF